MAELLHELSGEPTFEDVVEQPPWFVDGSEHEAEAIGAYAFERGVEVMDSPFIEHPSIPYVGASPDGLVGDDGGIEVKCCNVPARMLKFERIGLPAEHRPQVQGNLWVTGRAWWDFVVWFTGREYRLHVHRVYPDLDYHKRLAEACAAFWGELNDLMRAEGVVPRLEEQA